MSLHKNDKFIKRWIFAITGMANLSVCFAINSLNLALPTLAAEFGVSQGDVSWLALVYSLIPCCMLLICGKMADLYGYKRQYEVGFCFFAFASLFAPLLSHNLVTLIFFRALQGLGYSILISITQATISRTFDDHERGKALGINSIFVSVGLASGPTIGGMLITHFSWHAIFYSSIPFCLVGLVATILVMPEDNRKTPSNIKLDWLGGLFFASSIGTLAISLNFSDDWGVTSFPFLFCMGIFLLTLGLFIRREKKISVPLMPLELFKNRTFSLANATCALSYMTQQLTIYVFPFFLINTLLLPSDKSGLILLASPAAMMIASPLGGSLSDRYGTRRPAVIGLLLIAMNCILVGFFKENMSIFFIILVLLMVGAGNGLSVSAINSAILGSVPKEHSGVASGMLATMRNIGNTFGTAIASVILIIRQTHYAIDPGLSKNAGYLLAQRDTFLVGFGLVLLAVLLIMRIPDNSQKQ
ncbi:MFS transporter [Clostridium aminobutyricum]|uniref:MFS transporter n=2 Tax=Clostridium aminobutyricum TaxID=33953 RepID=A0A939D7Q2_CLOAM|nr:MFS transporter [Clostridium aminobutyricum]MBN7772595.1 MFS transporter [Clostridium aminobutyricum]